MIDVSSVICFRDWGLDRLALALRSHAGSTLGERLETIVSDYGSRDGEAVREVVERHGGVYVRTEVNGPWSRSRALNAGLAHARGRMAITTDADMLFTPRAHEHILEGLDGDTYSVQLLQCRDLQSDFSSETIQDFDWDAFERNSVLRPRWGMGGMVAFRMEAYEYIRGYDERMEVYGGEDIDFAQRLRRAGYRLNWIDDPACRIFHVWHESSRKSADDTPAGKLAIQKNSDIVTSDRTWIRNLGWKYPRKDSRPLVTVSIATFNRAGYLGECLDSVLSQSVQDFEVIVVDDGSSDHTRDVISKYRDDRVRYLQQENQGVSVARNLALAEARAPFIVIQDDDDVMLPTRIEAHFGALEEGIHGTYGGWVDFDDRTGDLAARPGRQFGLGQMLYSGGVMAHGTLMMRTDILRRFGYNPLLRAGTDFNLAIRMTMAGVKLRHTGQFHILRRFHGGNLTNIISDHQKDSARKTTNLFRRRFTPAQEAKLREEARAVPFATCEGEDDLFRKVGASLPDRMVRRTAYVHSTGSVGVDRLDAFAASRSLGTETFVIMDERGEFIDRCTCLYGASRRDVLDLLNMGFAAEIEVEHADEAQRSSAPPGPLEVLERASDLMQDRSLYYSVSLAPSGSEAAAGIWEMEASRRQLTLVGRRQFAVVVKEAESLEGALECVELARTHAADAEHLLLQPAA